jgi:response regulator RpfG family c-di-GMP phosphodiesterase
LAARIVALADFYDALTTKRPYKEAVSHERAREMIVDGAGRHFDPQLVEAFLACQEQFLQVAVNPPSGFDP